VSDANGLPAPEGFDPRAGGRIERLVFDHRGWTVALAAALTIVLGAVAATRLVVNADFEKTMPRRHPFVRNWLERRDALPGLGNALQVVVESVGGDIYDPQYLEALRQVSDELFLTPGVDRAWVRSIWTPSVRWTEVTEEGFRGGAVMPDDYDGSPAALEALRRNVRRAGITGTLVAPDARSSVVVVPLLVRDPVTGEALDYGALSDRLEALRARFGAAASGGRVEVHVVGYAKVVGELLDGTREVLAYFAAAAAIAAAAIALSARCLRGTALVVGCAAVAVVWQAGLVAALGVPLDPFTVLVPFLVFALGVSHGAQKMHGILQDVGRGAPPVVAARCTFRRLFRAGLAALLTDAVGFGVLATIDVPAIREMALTATIGVSVLVFTSLVLLPVLLSLTGVSPSAARRSLGEGAGGRAPAAWRLLGRFTARRWAAGALIVTAAIVGAALAVARDVPIGDLRPGAPELRASSRYNRDDAFVRARYALSSDLFAVLVETGREGCLEYRTLVETDRLGGALRQLPAVRATASLADAVRQNTAGGFEGNPKWLTLSRDPAVLNHAALQAMTAHRDLVDAGCSLTPVLAWLSDRRAGTLAEVVRVADEFARAHGDDERRYLLAAGGAALEAATQMAVRDARWPMTLWAYAAVVLLSWATLRSGRAVLVAVLPVACTGVLCLALLAGLDVGMKLSTLPVVALGVGIPDFALYLLSVQLAEQRAGQPLPIAWRRALRSTGRPVILVGVTLAAGVVPWAWSPIRLQADMGILLTFIFLVNMVAALVLVPALSRFVLAGATLPRGRGRETRR
jgi:predicted RND superfamily exporter protein